MLKLHSLYKINAIQNTRFWDLLQFSFNLTSVQHQGPPAPDMADEDRRSDAVLSKEIQCKGKQPAIQQQTLYFVNCKYAIGLPNLTLQRMYWSGAESLGEIVTSSLVMGENKEMQTVQKRSIQSGHKIPPFTRRHQTSPNYGEESILDTLLSVKKRSISPIPPFTRLHQTSPKYDEEDNYDEKNNYYEEELWTIYFCSKEKHTYWAPDNRTSQCPFHQASPKADDSFSPTSHATSLTCSSDLQNSPKFRDTSSLNFPPASCQTSDSLFQTPGINTRSTK